MPPTARPPRDPLLTAVLVLALIVLVLLLLPVAWPIAVLAGFVYGGAWVLRGSGHLLAPLVRWLRQAWSSLSAHLRERREAKVRFSPAWERDQAARRRMK